MVTDHIDGNVLSVERHRAARGIQQSGQHPGGHRLSGSVRPQIADDVSRPHDEAHVVDGHHAEEPLDEVCGLQHVSTPVSQHRDTKTQRISWFLRADWTPSHAEGSGTSAQGHRDAEVCLLSENQTLCLRASVLR